MDVTAIGRTQILYDAVEAVSDAGHTIERIVTCEASDFYELTAAEFEELATELDATFAYPDDVNDPEFVATLRESESEIAISVNWATLLKRPVLDAFEHGIVNAHAGDLPRYRGNAAPNWAIINGEDEVGLTLHEMTEELDAGPVFAKRYVPLDEETYIGEVYDAMYETFPELFVDVIDAAASGSLDPELQDSAPSEVLRGYPRKPVDSELDWSKSAVALARLVRASSEPLFGAYTWLEGEKLRVWRAHSEEPPHDYLGTPGQVAERRPADGTVAVVTGDGFLVLETVEREQDEERHPATDILTSNRTRLVPDVTSEVGELRAEVARLRQRVAELEES